LAGGSGIWLSLWGVLEVVFGGQSFVSCKTWLYKWLVGFQLNFTGVRARRFDCIFTFFDDPGLPMASNRDNESL
jgi:hypothetical protein